MLLDASAGGPKTTWVGRDETTKLRAEVERLQAKVSHLEEILAPQTFTLPGGQHLSKSEAKVASRLLLSRPDAPVPIERLYLALYDDANRDLLAVYAVICRLRRKVEPLGIVIRTVGKNGYSLDRASYDALRALSTITT